MSKVFVLDTGSRPLDPVHPGRARVLLTQGKAAVFKRYPFTIMLKVACDSPEVHPLRLKIDPGSRTSGLALVNDTMGEIVFAAELVHRGVTIKKSLDQRRAVRRGRRQRKTRYREPRFANRRRKDGWLAPSLVSRVANALTWTKRLLRLCPISAIGLELVKFDLQQIEHPEISGMEYQQGTLFGYELRQYLLPKEHWLDAACVGKSTPLQLKVSGVLPLLITATGHGSRQKCNVNEIGFPCSKPKASKKVECRASAIASAPWFIVAMATAIKKEGPMHRRTPPRLPNKERAIPTADGITGASWRGSGESHGTAHVRTR